MNGKTQSFLEAFLLLFLTLALYLVLMLSFPPPGKPHGLFFLAEVSGVLSLQLNLQALMFYSACAYALVGALMIHWAPVLTPGLMAYYLGTLYFLTWVDTVVALSLSRQTWGWMGGIFLGLAFLMLFFAGLNALREGEEPKYLPPSWKTLVAGIWFFSWMCLNSSLAVLMVLDSFRTEGRIPLVLGSWVVAYLSYLLFAFLRKSGGKDTSRDSYWAGRVFAGGLVVLAVLYVVEKWDLWERWVL